MRVMLMCKQNGLFATGNNAVNKPSLLKQTNYIIYRLWSLSLTEARVT